MFESQQVLYSVSIGLLTICLGVWLLLMARSYDSSRSSGLGWVPEKKVFDITEDKNFNATPEFLDWIEELTIESQKIIKREDKKE